MRVLFRADSSLTIGSGHVARCLTLAQELAGAGAECAFVCRDLDGNRTGFIEAAGFQVHLLPAPDGAEIELRTDHSAWAGVDWRQDAAETRAFLDGADWLVLDHYAFDAEWQRAAVAAGTRLLVIDDLADRPHACDLLMDQNLGRGAADYDGLVPENARVLAGPTYALLRPEFRDLRAEALAHRIAKSPERLIIAMGGVDLNNATGEVLGVLRDWSTDISVCVVMGGKAPHLEAVRAQAAQMPFACEVAVDITDIGARMAAADLAIGAVGGTTWERCALGLPTLMLTIADNQQPAAAAMDAAGAAIWAGDQRDTDWTDRLRAGLGRLTDGGALHAMSRKAAAICDGDGALRVVAGLTDSPVTLRPSTLVDARRIWEWRSQGGANRFYRSTSEPAYPDHYAWFAKALGSQDRLFCTVLKGALPVGYLRLDLTETGAWVSICLSADVRGAGIGGQVLAHADQWARELGQSGLWAEIHPDNRASLQVFERSGYIRQPDVNGFCQYYRKLEGSE